MKKLSTLIAIALIVTIGGVYAAWSYSQGTTAEVEITREINMAQINTNGSKGTISATPENNFAFLVDDDGSGTYTAKLVGTGKLNITFTANPGADSSVASGIEMVATIEVRSATNATYTYGDYTNLVPLTHKQGENVINITNNTVSKTATLTADQILGAIVLTSVKLPTKDANDKYHAVLKDYTIYITISEKA